MQSENEDQRAACQKRGAAGVVGRATKRQRSGDPEAVFDELLAEAGCELSSSRAGQEYEVEDPRRMRRMLEQQLTLNADLRADFLSGLEEHLQPADVLHAALRPMAVTSPTAPITGDSFVRVLLNIAPLQGDLARVLLHRLPDFCSGSAAESEAERAVPQLILGQFRWLDHVVDAHALIALLLEVLPVCPEEAKRDAIAFLPEVASEEDHEAVLGTLMGLMEEDSANILPAIEALSNLSLAPELQAEAVGAVLERLQAADPGDLPMLVRFLLQHAMPSAGSGKAKSGGDSAAPGSLKKVVCTLRESLHFACPSDPRRTAPDRKQKGRVLSGGESLEGRLLESVRQAMQLNPAAAEAVCKELRGLAEPRQHCMLDFWLLLLLLSLGPERRKAAEALLRRKLSEGQAGPEWLERAVAGGHARVLADHFPALLSLCQQLLRVAAEPVQAGGVALYCALFTHFSEAYTQQEVLRALHSHLGAHVGSEASAALNVLSRLAREQTGTLVRYAAFLTNILDYVDRYTDAQVHQVFAMFSELVAHACRQADEAGAAAGGGRSRMEDELMIFLRKQLSSPAGNHRRVGIIGTVALVKRLAAATSDGAETEGEVGKRYGEAMLQLKSTFEECQQAPEAFAFLCDELTRSVAHAAVSGKLLDELFTLLSQHFESTYMADAEGSTILGLASRVTLAGASVAACLWLNLDGKHAGVALNLLGLVAAEVAPGTQRSRRLVSLFATIRLLAVLQLAIHRDLSAIDAVLGCPLSMFPESMTSPEEFAGLAAEQRQAVLLGLWYALNWFRELINAFAGQTTGAGDRNTMELKLFARLREACQLEAVLDSLLPLAPPLFQLPPLSSTLDSRPAAPGPMVPKKAAAKGGKGGGGKKAVKFTEPEDSQGAAPSGRADSHSHGGSSSTQGGSSTTSQAVVGTQGGAAAIASRGLSHLPAERWKLRSLLLPMLSALNLAGQAVECYAMLPPAAYILADLHEKLRAALVPAKRPTFLVAKGGSRPALPADVSGLTASDVLAALCPVLPVLRCHLDAAFKVMMKEVSDEDMQAHDREFIWSASGSAATQLGSHEPHAPEAAAVLANLENRAAQAAMSPWASATQVVVLGLECIKLLLRWPPLVHDRAHRGALQALLLAFSDKECQPNASQPGLLSDEQLWQLCKQFFIYFTKSSVMCMAEDGEAPAGQPSFSACHSVLHILDATYDVAQALGATGSKLLLRMRKRLLQWAEDMLQASWAAKDDVKGKGNGWRGRGSALFEVVSLRLRHSEDRLAAIIELAQGVMAQVPDASKDKAEAGGVGPYPCLTGSSLVTWYRAAFEALQTEWEEVVASAVSASKDEGLRSDEECVSSIAERCKRCAATFTALLGITRTQEHRVAVLAQAVKGGGKFVETFFKVLPFWSQVITRRRDAFQAMLKDLQKGTRVLQTVCGEGKSGSILPLAARAPQVKRTLERFIFQIKAFVASDASATFWIGNLKHKDLAGRVVPSQLALEEPEDDDDDGDDDDDDDEEEEEEDEEEEEEGYGNTPAAEREQRCARAAACRSSHIGVL